MKTHLRKRWIRQKKEPEETDLPEVPEGTDLPEGTDIPEAPKPGEEFESSEAEI